MRNSLQEASLMIIQWGMQPMQDSGQESVLLFYFIILKTESITSLLIHPFAFMEGSLKNYMGVTPDEAVN